MAVEDHGAGHQLIRARLWPCGRRGIAGRRSLSSNDASRTRQSPRTDDMRSRIHILIAVLVCGFSVMPARAQTAAPAGVVVSGVIGDQSAGVIPGAAVTLIGQARAMRSTTSPAD